MDRTNEDWLAALAADEAEAFAELHRLLRANLQRSFGGKLDSATLDDLTQDAVVRVRDKLTAFGGRSRFTTWATSVAVNLALQVLRKQRRTHVPLEDAIAQAEAKLAEPVHEAPVERAELYDLLDQAIDEVLSDKQRRALLGKLGGHSMDELVHQLGTNRNALYKLLHDARKRLRTWLEAHGVDATLLEAP